MVANDPTYSGYFVQYSQPAGSNTPYLVNIANPGSLLQADNVPGFTLDANNHLVTINGIPLVMAAPSTGTPAMTLLNTQSLPAYPEYAVCQVVNQQYLTCADAAGIQYVPYLDISAQSLRQTSIKWYPTSTDPTTTNSNLQPVALDLAIGLPSFGLYVSAGPPSSPALGMYLCLDSGTGGGSVQTDYVAQDVNRNIWNTQQMYSLNPGTGNLVLNSQENPSADMTHQWFGFIPPTSSALAQTLYFQDSVGNSAASHDGYYVTAKMDLATAVVTLFDQSGNQYYPSWVNGDVTWSQVANSLTQLTIQGVWTKPN